MKRLVWVAIGLIWGGTLLAAEGADPAKLQARKKELEAKRSELQAQARQAQGRIAKSAALAKERAAVAKAGETFEAKKASDRGLAKARERERVAVAAMSALVAKRVAASGELAEIEKTDAELGAKERSLRFKKGLLGLKLYHEGSQVRIAAEAEKDVVAARKAASDAASEARSNPSRDVVAARKALQEATSELSKLWLAMRDNRDLRRASEVEAKARAALGDAERSDRRRDGAAKAREAYENANKEALAGVRAARPYLRELEDVTGLRKEAEGQRRGIDYLLGLHREAIKKDGGGKVASAVKALAKADERYEKILRSRSLSKLRSAVDGAGTTFGEKHEAMFGAIAEYQTLTQKERELQKLLDELSASALSETSARGLRKLLPGIQAKRGEVGTVAYQKRDIRMSVGGAEWDQVYHAGGRAQRALDAAVDENAKASSARRAVADATRELESAVSAELGNVKAAAVVLAEKKEIEVRLLGLRYREAIARHHLYSGDSEINAEVNRDGGVVRLRAAYNKTQNEIRNEPTRAVTKTRKAYEEARADHGKVSNALQQDRKYKKAAAVRRAAEQALRMAEQKDPAGKKVAEAQQTASAKLSETIAASRTGRSLVAELNKLNGELDATTTQRRELSNRRHGLRGKIERGDDPDVVTARKGIAEARQALKEAENSEKLVALQKEISDARAALDAKRKLVESEDMALKAVQTEMGAVNKELRDVSGQLREIEREKQKAAAAKKSAAKK